MNQNQSRTFAVIRFVNIILAAILAGVSLGLWIGFKPKDMSAATFVEQQQNILHRLRNVMPALVIGATAVTAVSAFVQRRNQRVFVALLAAASLFVACICITVLGNKPIDDLILTWNASSLPENWKQLRDKWWMLHVWRTAVEFAGLFIITWTVAIPIGCNVTNQ